jgi:hypothetical protein
MKTRILTLASIAAIVCGTAGLAHADDDARAITARVHGTFQDAQGGGGVLSGDMYIVRFEVRNEAVTAIGKIVGALADAQGNVLGLVQEELALPVERVTSTCNQLRMELQGGDAEIKKVPVHFDMEVAGFDSRDGDSMVPKALTQLCAVQGVLRTRYSVDTLTQALNEVTTALATDATK